jgi:hypothetical protein
MPKGLTQIYLKKLTSMRRCKPKKIINSFCHCYYINYYRHNILQPMPTHSQSVLCVQLTNSYLRDHINIKQAHAVSFPPPPHWLCQKVIRFRLLGALTSINSSNSPPAAQLIINQFTGPLIAFAS